MSDDLSMEMREKYMRAARQDWIRETARELLVARESRTPVALTFGVPWDDKELLFVAEHYARLAEVLWDRCREER